MRRATIALSILLAAVLFCGLLIEMVGPPQAYDEGISVVGASAVLDGRIPYRDFWTMYPPGSFVLLAALFSVFGQSLLAVRIFSVVVFLAVATLATWLTYPVETPPQTRPGKRPPWLGALVLVGQLVLAREYGHWATAVPPAILIALISCAVLRRQLSASSYWPSIVAGLLAGMAAIFRHDLGAYLAAAQLVWLALVFNSRPGHRPAMREQLLALLAYGAAAAGPVLFVVALLVVWVDSKLLIEQLIRFPLFDFGDYRSLPFPSLGFDTLLCYLPLLVIPLGLTVSLWGLMGRRAPLALDRVRLLQVLLLSLVGAALMMQLSVGPSMSHAYPSLVFALPLLGLMWNAQEGSAGHGLEVWLARLHKTAVALAFVALVDSTVDCVGDLNRFRRRLPDRIAMEAGRAKGLSQPRKSPNYGNVIEWVRQNTDPNESIYVGVMRHDTLISNDMMLYFLTERRSATRFAELSPGVVTTEIVQREMIRSLTESDTRVLVLAPSISAQPNLSAVSSGVHLLDEYIAKNFVLVIDYDSHQIWTRRACPDCADSQAH